MKPNHNQKAKTSLYCLFKLWMFLCILISGCKHESPHIEDEQTLWASEWDGDLDNFLNTYKSFSYSDGRPFDLSKEEFNALSEEEESLAVRLLCSYFKKKDFSTHKQKPFSINEYFRQYIGYQKDGHIMVHINIYTHIPYRKDPQCLCIYMEDLTKTLINEEYGGAHYGTIIIDLTDQKVKSFSLNKDS